MELSIDAPKDLLLEGRVVFPLGQLSYLPVLSSAEPHVPGVDSTLDSPLRHNLHAQWLLNISFALPDFLELQ